MCFIYKVAPPVIFHEIFEDEIIPTKMSAMDPILKAT